MSFGAPLVLAALLLVPAAIVWYVRQQRYRRRAAAAFATPALLASVAPRRPGLAPPRADARVPARARRAHRRGGQAAADGRGPGRARVDHARDRRARARWRRPTSGPRAWWPRAAPPGTSSTACREASTSASWRSTGARACCRARRPSATTSRPRSAGSRPAAAPRPATPSPRRCRILRQPTGINKKPPPSAIVLLSDGASTKGKNPIAAAQEAKRAKIPVYTVALGTPDGTITVPRPGGQSGTETRAVPPDPRQPRPGRARLGRPVLHRRQRERPQARLPAPRLAARHRAAQAPADLELRRRRARAPAGRRRDVAGVVRAAGVNFQNDKGAG